MQEVYCSLLGVRFLEVHVCCHRFVQLLLIDCRKVISLYPELVFQCWMRCKRQNP